MSASSVPALRESHDRFLDAGITTSNNVDSRKRTSVSRWGMSFLREGGALITKRAIGGFGTSTKYYQ